MADTPVNLPPRTIAIGKTSDGKDVFANHVWYQAFYEAVVKRIGGPSSYVVSDLAGLTATDGGFIVGDGSNFGVESGSTARASLDVPSNSEAILQSLINAKGDLIVGSADNATARLAVGTDTHVLTADSSATNGIKWAAGSGGGALVLLEQHTASTSSSLDFTTCISSTYDEYVIELLNVVLTNASKDLWLRISTDGGTNYLSTNVYSVNRLPFIHTGTASPGGNDVTAQVAQMAFAGGNILSNSSNYGISGNLRLFNPGGTSVYKRFLGHVSYFDLNSDLAQMLWQGVYTATTAINAFRFLPSDAATIASGTIRVYGIAKS